MGLSRAVDSYRKAITALRDQEDAINMDAAHSLGWRRTKLKELEMQEQRLYNDFFKVWDRTTKKAA